MVGAPSNSPFSRLFRPEFAFVLIVLMGAGRLLTYLVMMVQGGDDFHVAGDFVAFWTAARETLQGEIVGLYAREGLMAGMAEHWPKTSDIGLTWQYPPHSTLIFTPLGLLPFYVAFAVWTALGLCMYAMALRQIRITGSALLALLATSVVFIAIITGQNGLFTAALMIVAVVHADKRPLLAGLAAALLTIKPQLGFLLPLAFIAGGAWRTAAYAALGSLLLWGSSFAFLGLEPWRAFLGSVTSVAGTVDEGVMPLYKMVNVYSAARLAGIPTELALGLYGATVVLLIAATSWVWHRTEDIELRLAAICGGTLMVAPYAFYYELSILLPAVFIMARRGFEHGWLSLEREILAALVVLSLLLPGPIIQSGVSYSFIVVLLSAVLIARRLHAELRFQSDIGSDLTKAGAHA
ncbi:MAG: glycosyltransferase family 87 protein [Pseudomonadota bacterium]